MVKITTARSLLALIIVVVVMFFARTLFQEGNPLPVFAAIFRLEFTQLEVVPITGEGHLFLQRAGKGEAPLTGYLGESGWQFKDRLGSAIFYEKDGVMLRVSSRMFTRRYVVYEFNIN